MVKKMPPQAARVKRASLGWLSIVALVLVSTVVGAAATDVKDRKSTAGAVALEAASGKAASQSSPPQP